MKKLYTPVKRKDADWIYPRLYGVEVVYQSTGFGKRPRLVCPVCGRRYEVLYSLDGANYSCRKCIGYNPYKGIQNTTKGGASRIEYTMRKMALKNGLDWTLHEFFDGGAVKYIVEDRRPRYMRKSRFSDLLARLELLDLIRCDCIMNESSVDVGLIAEIERASPESLMLKSDIYLSILLCAERYYKLPIIDRLLRKSSCE